MTKILKLLLVVLLVSCHKYSEINKSETNNDKPQVAQESDAAITVQEEDWLIIGGQRVEGSYAPSLGKYEYYRNIDIENIEDILLYIDPQDTNCATSFEGIERLVNLERLYIYGRSWDTIDYTPLRDLRHLKMIQFVSGKTNKLTKAPDLSELASKNLITDISFADCALTSMDNIEHLPNLRLVTVSSNYGDLTSIKGLNQARQMEELKIFSNEESVYRIEEISSLADLKLLRLSGKSVDAKGIELLSSLEAVDFSDCDVINAQYLAQANGIEQLRMHISDKRPNIDYFRTASPAAKLKELYITSDTTTLVRGNGDPPYQVLDVSPIAHLSNLEYLSINGFIIKNISAMDRLEHLRGIVALFSQFYSPAEKSRHDIMFEYDGR